MLSNRKIWFIAAVLLLTAVTGVLGRGIWLKTSLDESSRTAVTNAIQAVIVADEYSALTDRALLGRINDRPAVDMPRTLAFTKKTLGNLREVLGVYGAAEVPLVNFSAGAIVAQYEADLVFANAPATLRLTLQYVDAQWRFDEFRLFSPALIN